MQTATVTTRIKNAEKRPEQITRLIG